MKSLFKISPKRFRFTHFFPSFFLLFFLSFLSFFLSFFLSIFLSFWKLQIFLRRRNIAPTVALCTASLVRRTEALTCRGPRYTYRCRLIRQAARKNNRRITACGVSDACVPCAPEFIHTLQGDKRCNATIKRRGSHSDEPARTVRTGAVRGAPAHVNTRLRQRAHAPVPTTHTTHAHTHTLQHTS